MNRGRRQRRYERTANDAFDAAHDRQHRSGRPIPSGAVAESTVFAIGVALIGSGLILLLLLGLSPGGAGLGGFAAGLALTIAILVYDAWHKGNPIGPLLMGLCRVLVYVTTAASIAGVLPRDLFWAAAMALCYLIGLTYAAKQEDLKQPGRLWPLAFLGAAFVYGLPIARIVHRPRCLCHVARRRGLGGLDHGPARPVQYSPRRVHPYRGRLFA